MDTTPVDFPLTFETVLTDSNPDSGHTSGASTQPAAAIEVDASRWFAHWLREANLSLAISTYQSGKLFLVGHRETGPEGGGDLRTAVFERTFERVMGLWSNDQTLWMSTAWQLWRLENDLSPDEQYEGYDRNFVPRAAFVTGEIDIHDLGVGTDGRLVFVNTLFGCLATTSDRYSFEPLWKPSFLSKLAPEDRCHLNGLAWENGCPRYVTVCGQTDVFDGWRGCRTGGGAVLDTTAGGGEEEVVATGLSMPHSPRLLDGKLWLLDSGTGYLGYILPHSGVDHFERVAFCPGFARGLAIHNGCAIVGLSRARRERTFYGLPLDDELAKRKAEPMCGVMVIELASGNVLHWLRLGGAVDELYDVAVLPGVKRPRLVGFRNPEVRHRVAFETDAGVKRWMAAGTVPG